MAGDHGRKLHELPWLYLDSVGHEYGPIPGWTMREWLMLGRFPVGRDLRVRLPEWERHLPLHQLYPDLSSAFVLPPAWPDIYTDGVLQDQEVDGLFLTQGVSSADKQPVDQARPFFYSNSGTSAGCSSSRNIMVPSFRSNAPRIESCGSAAPRSRSEVASSHLSSQDQLSLSSDQFSRMLDSPPAPRPPFILERLVQEDQLLPQPPPQPSQRQLRELLSQPQEGPPLWQDQEPGDTLDTPHAHHLLVTEHHQFGVAEHDVSHQHGRAMSRPW